MNVVHLNNIKMKLIDDEFNEVMQLVKPNPEKRDGKTDFSKKRD